MLWHGKECPVRRIPAPRNDDLADVTVRHKLPEPGKIRLARREWHNAMMMTAVGLMSGTSLDGVDVALIETNGKQIKAFGPSSYRPYTDRERSLLLQALTEATELTQRDARPGILREAERAVTIAHAEAVAIFTAQNRIAPEDIDIVGFHGQTVLHRPERGLTVQIGDAAALAKAIHIPVMHDFRAADVAAGGQGRAICAGLPPRAGAIAGARGANRRS